MASASCQCASCGKVVQPVRSMTGQMICPSCTAILEASAPIKTLPRPQPMAVKSSRQPAPGAARVTTNAPRRQLASPRPATPDEALAGSGLSSGPWTPPPDPGPSPDAAHSRVNRFPTSTPEPKGGLFAPPTLYFVIAGALVLVLGAVAIILAIGKSTKPDPVKPVVASATPSATPTPSPAPVPQAIVTPVAPAQQPRTVNLMPMIDPVRDAVDGKWTMQNDGITSDTMKMARIRIPYAPPEEYDYRIEFTRNSGVESVAQLFPKGTACVSWVIYGWKGSASGLQLIGGKAGNMNSTTVHDLVINVGERHTSLVRVRKDSIEVFMDGKPTTSYQGDGSDMTTSKGWELKGASQLGFGSNTSPTTFHTVELIEITGHGLAVDPAAK